MELHDVSFFIRNYTGQGLHNHIDYLNIEGRGTITVAFNEFPSMPYANPRVIYFFDSEQQVINFCNSVIQAKESFLKEMKRRIDNG